MNQCLMRTCTGVDKARYRCENHFASDGDLLCVDLRFSEVMSPTLLQLHGEAARPHFVPEWEGQLLRLRADRVSSACAHVQQYRGGQAGREGRAGREVRV